MNFQALIDGMNLQAERQRSESQMTLGEMVEALKLMPADALVDGLEEPHSYRGYYSDLAFEMKGDRMRAADLLSMCQNAMGHVFEGYKGGDFPMHANSPLWRSNYGECGKKIMSISDSGDLELADDEF